MRELREWLGRLSTVDGSQPRESVALRTAMNRVATPSPLDFDDSVVRVEDMAAEVYLFGALPAHLSVMSWPDLAGRADFMADIAIATQLGAVMTMASGRLVHVASAEMPVRMEGFENYTFLPALVTDRELRGPLPDDIKAKTESFLQLVAGLPDADLGPVGNALDLHYASILLHTVDLNAAYTLAVAGIETLAQSYGSPLVDWHRWGEADRFDKAFAAAGLSDDQQATMRATLLAQPHLGLRQRFASYVCDRMPETWWSTTVQDYTPALEMTANGIATFTGQSEGETWPIEQFVPSDPALLRRRLLATYDARSSYVHVGRRTVTAMTTMTAALGDPADGRAPLDYLGIRRVLGALVEIELRDKSEPAKLPVLRLRHAATE